MAQDPLKVAPKGKERELRSRDELYFGVARRIFLEEGFHSLTLGRIAEDTGFSRATVYERFGCKENLMAELALRCGDELASVMERGLQFPGRPRERLLAMAESISQYAERYAGDLRILRTIDAEAVFSRVSSALQTAAAKQDAHLFQILMRPIEEAISAGDLVLGPGRKPQSLCFALWTMVDGWAAAVAGWAPLQEIGLPNLLGELFQNAQYLLDGIGWRPLSSEWDYEETYRRLRATLFPKTGQKSRITRNRRSEPG